MKNNILVQFDDICKKYSSKLCFVDKHKEVSFSNVHDDIFRMISLFKAKGLKEHDKAVIFVLPSYEFYILLIAGVYYHLNMVVIDSFKDKDRTKNMFEQAMPKAVFCSNFTSLLRGVLPKGQRFINISGFAKYKKTDYTSYDDKGTVLTTFTSGTTGMPKLIERNLSSLEEQMNLVKKNMVINPNDIVLGTLPIYVLFSLMNGYTTVISKYANIKLINKYKVNAILTSIYNLLSIKKPIPQITKAYCGGAILYPNEANRIKTALPNAEITYVYGSSEGVLIAKTTLDLYIQNGYFAFDKFIDGMNVKISREKEIVIDGKCVLSENKQHFTGDLGEIKDGKLYILGRKKYSKNDFFNFIEDSKVIKNNPEVSKAFTFTYEDQKYLVFEGKLTHQYSGFKVYKFNKLPMDLKHKTKLNYGEAINKIKSMKDINS